jgi:hypothetical protein
MSNFSTVPLEKKKHGKRLGTCAKFELTLSPITAQDSSLRIFGLTWTPLHMSKDNPCFKV